MVAHLPSLGVVDHKGEQVSTRCVNESGCKQLKTSYNGEAHHQKKGRCATISNPTLERLRLHSIVSYSIVWCIQAAQASYSGEAQHQKKGSCATIGIPTLDRPRLHSTVSSSIVWWMQAAQATYNGEAQHQKKGRGATIGNPTL